MDRLRERLAQARSALAALRELTGVESPSVVQRDAMLLRFMLASEAVWKTSQRFLQQEHGLEVGSPRESVRASLQVGLLDGERAERALELMRDRNLIVHTYNEELAQQVLARIPGHALVLAAWLESLVGA